MLNTTTFGDLLRHWRKLRKLSQMDLAFAVDVSTRHLSFVETGRSKPSDALVMRLASALKLSLRHQNALLVAAGYAPRHPMRSLDDEQTKMVKTALQRILEKHDPYPAIVTQRNYDMLLWNQGFASLTTWLMGENALQKNIYRAIFAEDGLKPYFEDPERIHTFLLARLYDEALTYQTEGLWQLYEECQNAVSENLAPITPMNQYSIPVLTFTLQKQETRLTFFSTMTTFGTPLDVTVQELRIESLFPADDETRAFFEDTVFPR